MKDLLERVIKDAGGQSALASQLGRKPQQVYQWRVGLRPIPPKRAIQISKLYPYAKPQLLCEQLEEL